MNVKIAARKLLKNIYAGKEEEPEDTEKVPVTENRQPNNTAYLFFNANEPIAFNDLDSLIKEKGDLIIPSLESGNFKWTYAVFKIDDGKDINFYHTQLNQDGSMGSGGVLLNAKGEQLSAMEMGEDKYRQKIEIFKATFFESERLTFEQSPVFIKKNFSNNDLKPIINSSPVQGALNNFDGTYLVGNYRVRLLISTNKPDGIPANVKAPLVGPRYEVPTADDKFGSNKNQPFFGTENDIAYLKKKASESKGSQEKTVELSEKEAPMKENQPTNFNPTDEQEKTTKNEVRDKYSKSAQDEKDSAIKELKKDDPDANYYTGDNSVMQDLVRRQHKKMKIRKTAQFTSSQPSSMGSPTSTTPKGKSPSIPISEKPEENVKSSKVLQDIAKQQEEVNKKLKTINQQQSNIFSGKSASSLMLKRVLSNYLKK